MSEDREQEQSMMIPPIDRSSKLRRNDSAKREELVSFDEWYSLREKQIPRHHHKEILKADFKGQKMPEKATMDQFDSALIKYGVKLT